jgi:hypothetical protein
VNEPQKEKGVLITGMGDFQMKIGTQLISLELFLMNRLKIL